MSKSRLSWIIGLMSASLLGLIAFQWYWIGTVINGNEERFRQDVMEAIHTVIYKLEKQETLEYVNRQVIQQAFSTIPIDPTQVRKVPRSDGSVHSVDNASNYFYASEDSADGSSFEFFLSMEGSMEGEVTISTQTGVKRLEFNPQENEERKFTNEKQNQQSASAEQRIIEEALEKVTNKSDFVITLLNDLIVPRKISNRINADQLDSLLRNELANRGINTPFNYAVLRPQSGHLVSINDPTSQEALLQSEFRANLFPNDIMGEPSLLFVDFPNKARFLMNKIWFTMSSSGLLIIIILFCFAYAIHTIVLQKNISTMKNDFINNMTHEFKTPIATIGLAVEALQDKDIIQIPSMHEKYLGVISDENKRLGSQVEKVLQMAILDRKELKLTLKSLHVHDLVNLAVDKISLQMDKRAGEMKVSLEAERDEILGDEIHLLNVVLNLLDNAIKYSEDSPKIMIRSQVSRGDFVLSIKDHGVGMSREEIKHIFQKFYRVPTGNLHNVKGFGLGLSYVKSIIEELKGTIDVDSEIGNGTRFVIRLPLNHG